MIRNYAIKTYTWKEDELRDEADLSMNLERKHDKASSPKKFLWFVS